MMTMMMMLVRMMMMKFKLVRDTHNAIHAY